MKPLIEVATTDVSLSRRQLGRLLTVGCASMALPLSAPDPAEAFLFALFLRLLAGNLVKSVIERAVLSTVVRTALGAGAAIFLGAVASAAVDTTLAAASEPPPSEPPPPEPPPSNPPPPNQPRIDALWFTRRDIEQNCFALEIGNQSDRDILVEDVRVGLVDVRSNRFDDTCSLGIVEAPAGSRATFAFAWPKAPAPGLKRIVSQSHASCSESGLILVGDYYATR